MPVDVTGTSKSTSCAQMRVLFTERRALWGPLGFPKMTDDTQDELVKIYTGQRDSSVKNTIIKDITR